MTKTFPRRDEHGLAIIYLALTLTVLMIMAALVVDIGNARQERSKGQAAVDAASLSGAQILDTTTNTQTVSIFNMAANTAYRTILSDAFTTPFNYATLAAAPDCAPAPAGAPKAVCKDFTYSSGGVAYDVMVTTPFELAGKPAADNTMLNVKTCWGVPTTFGKAIGVNSLTICAHSTAQNGVGTGGASNGGCGAANELINITDTLSSGALGAQTISARFHSTSGAPLDLTNVHFVVQTQYQNFIQVPKGAGGTGVAGVSFSLTAGSGTDYTISYTLPNTIDTNSGDGSYGTAYSNTFSANLQVIDSTGQSCGSASWSTCNPGNHDPIFDGGNSGDTNDNQWGLGLPGSGNHTTGGSGIADDNADNDGHDLNTATDSDDTVTPSLGTLVSAGNPIGAIYNDEQPLRAASVAFVIDGTTVGWSGNGVGTNFAPGKFAFTDPSTVYDYAPQNTVAPLKPTGATAPTPIVMPNFGTVDPVVSTAQARSAGTIIRITLQDTMGNPMAGETVTLNAVNQITALTGRTDFAAPPAGTYTVSYTGARGIGNFSIVLSGSPLTVSSKTPATVGKSKWPTTPGSTSLDGGTQYGESAGVMYNSTGLTNGWHSAVLWANDGDVTTSGGDCSIVAWAFGSTGGTPGPGTLHLID